MLRRWLILDCRGLLWRQRRISSGIWERARAGVVLPDRDHRGAVSAGALRLNLCRRDSCRGRVRERTWRAGWRWWGCKGNLGCLVSFLLLFAPGGAQVFLVVTDTP